MSSSDLDLDLDAPQDSSTSARMSDKQRKLLARKDALARLKRSSTRPAPRFLGADPQDDAEGDPDASQDVDFEQWERRDLERRRQRRAGAAPGAGSASSTRESDPVLSHAFDDLFDLGGNNGADDGIHTGEGSTGADVDGTGVDAVDGVDAEGAPAKKRRVVARMDETRLLGPSGFPRLREDLKKVRIKGKGHEVRLLSLSRPPPTRTSRMLTPVHVAVTTDAGFAPRPEHVPALGAPDVPQDQLSRHA